MTKGIRMSGGIRVLPHDEITVALFVVAWNDIVRSYAV